jgi:hypothetical protein
LKIFWLTIELDLEDGSKNWFKGLLSAVLKEDTNIWKSLFVTLLFRVSRTRTSLVFFSVWQRQVSLHRVFEP